PLREPVRNVHERDERERQSRYDEADAREVVDAINMSHRVSIQNVVVYNLRQIANGCDMYFIKEGKTTATWTDLFEGPSHLLSADKLPPAGGEDYHTVFPVQMGFSVLKVYVPELKDEISYIP
ncbi:MAG TPA: hypothetical protein PKI32_06900, partial [Opitutales bacterium]|nr:hypothetical protein [Opitutales bacterium]